MLTDDDLDRIEEDVSLVVAERAERLRARVEELEAELERRDRELVCCKDCWDAGKRP